MRRTNLKRGGFLKRKTPLRSYTKLRVVGKSDTSEVKQRIQSLLRKIVILRDGGCILRNSNLRRKCGGYTKDGKIILQAEHLHSRAHSISFADSRLAICICRDHHIFYKPQYADEYYTEVKKLIGEERSKLLERVKQDYRPHKVDWKLQEVALIQEYNQLCLVSKDIRL